MKTALLITTGLIVSFFSGFLLNGIITKQPKEIVKKEIENNKTKKETSLKLGAFSVSLNVKDLSASKTFYEKLGFKISGGDMAKNYLVMKNENAIIGLFNGMFEHTILTFNPGWDENSHNIEKFDDVRFIQQELKKKGVKLNMEANEKTKGPAYIMFSDPDGNDVLIDQHR